MLTCEKPCVCVEAMRDHREICNQLRLTKTLRKVNQVCAVVFGRGISQPKPAPQMDWIIILPRTITGSIKEQKVWQWEVILKMGNAFGTGSRRKLDPKHQYEGLVNR